MTSSMLTGERRWASARRSGMTVLGKVAVPKPINLPSQRLENHGLDPNVEIVPKGAYGWGGKSPSSTPNAWGSSSLSSNTDSGSPSYLNGRPSSGGSGTRPSTAGSDRSREPVTSAWASNSRPSSSSGALTSNQASHASLRPRSAETRPGSSQLSRFAEPLSDNSVAWAAPGTAEKLGGMSSKNDGFSLASGDFPTLGSEKDNSLKNADSQDHGSHGRPGSSAGVASVKEGSGDSAGDASLHTNVKSGSNGGPWRRDNTVYGEDGGRPNMEKWHTDPQSYPNASVPPQHYDSWHGPSVNNHPGGVWYRGPPGGPPPFGSPVAPGGFPMEPFPYYRGQIPPPLANSQPVPPPGAGPRGPHPKNGDMYRPHMHDAYIRPGMPIRPGFYPGPVPYENYYGPPMAYCNPNERDVPFMGMAMGPHAFNRYPGQNVPDPGNSHGRTSGYGPSSKAMVSDQVESVHPHDVRGPYKVLMKHHDGREGKDEEHKWDDTKKTTAPYPLKGDEDPRKSWENDLRTVNKKEDESNARRMALGEEASFVGTDNQRVVKMKSPERVARSLDASEDMSLNKLEAAASISPEALAAPKDSSLIQKIEGLNAKARASDGWHDSKSLFGREEQKHKLQVGSHSTNEDDISPLSYEKDNSSGTTNSVPHEVKGHGSTVVSGTATSRRSTHGMHGRGDNRGKGRFNTQEADGWRKKPQGVDSHGVPFSGRSEISSVHGQDHKSTEDSQKTVLQPPSKNETESTLPVSDPSDSQRAKMGELAKRLKQREKEEEERTKEQRAKALAKLEELNRRTQTGDGASQKLEDVPTSSIQNRQEELGNLAQQNAVTSKIGACSSVLGSNPSTVTQSRGKLDTIPSSGVQKKHEESTSFGTQTMADSKSRASNSVLGASPSVVSRESIVNVVERFGSLPSNMCQTSKALCEETVVVHEQSKPFQRDASASDAVQCGSTQRVQDSSVSKQKRVSYRQKLNGPLEKGSNEKLASSSAAEASKIRTNMKSDATKPPEPVVDEIVSNSEANLPVNSSVTVESSAHHRRKNRSGRNKYKEELPAAETLTSDDTLDTSAASFRPKNSESTDDRSVRSPTEPNDANQSLELQLLPNDETHSRVNNQWKSQHSRKTTRNPQGSKLSEKSQSGDAVVWAPVRSQNKTDVSDESNQNSSVSTVVSSSKNGQVVQNNPRNKRAEMERYIPKPVAKELSQQVNNNQVVPSGNQIISDENGESAEGSQSSGTATVKVSSVMEARSGDVRQNRSGKGHGSWRQRVAVETTNMSRNYQKSIDEKADFGSMKEQTTHQSEWGDGWNMPEDMDSSSTVHVPKDHLSVRGKRQQHRSHKGTAQSHNSDEKKTSSGDVEKEKSLLHPAAPEMLQTDSLASPKDGHVVGERSTSHWQPKSQPFSARGSRSSSNSNIGTDGGRASKRESALQNIEPLLPQPGKDAAAVRPQSHHDQSFSEKGKVGEVQADEGHKRDRKRGGPGSPSESHSSSNVERISSGGGVRKNGNHNNRFGREHEPRGDWSGSGKDNKQHNNVPALREKQRNNSHYEYQPVGPHNNNNKVSNLDPQKDGSHNTGGRYRERGQNHTRRAGGNGYGRQTGSSIQVDAGYD